MKPDTKQDDNFQAAKEILVAVLENTKSASGDSHSDESIPKLTKKAIDSVELIRNAFQD